MSPSGPKNNIKADDGSSKTEDDGVSSDQLVPDYAAGLVIFLKPFRIIQDVLPFQSFCFIYLMLSCLICYLLCFVWPIGRDQECVWWEATDDIHPTWRLWVTKAFIFSFLKQPWNLHLCCREKMDNLIPSPKYFNFKIYSEEQTLIP